MNRICRLRNGILSLLLAVLCSASAAHAQMDFSGVWGYVRNEDILRNPHPGEYGGMPLSEAGRIRANTWDATIQKLQVWQCRPHPIGYWARSPHDLLIQREINPTTREVVAYHVQMQESTMATIYMDGRPHPSKNALHTWNGFSTGEWIGDTLKITTTHLKESYLRRNGPVHSDETTMTQYWTRDDDLLTWVQIFHDPIYLTEPFVRVSQFRFDPRRPFETDYCVVADELPYTSRGLVPHYLPGEHPFLRLHSEKFDCPFEACQGGAETMYPEYRERLRQLGGVRIPRNRFPESGPGGD
jgi:hypothetical protein